MNRIWKAAVWVCLPTEAGGSFGQRRLLQILMVI